MKAENKYIYLVEAVVYIAMTAKPNAVRGQEVCKALGLPERYLEPELQDLVRQGVLRSVRGPKGGYVLAKERRNVTLADIKQAVKSTSEYAQSDFARLMIAPLIQKSEAEALKKLAETTIEELCISEAAKGYYAPKTPSQEFVI